VVTNATSCTPVEVLTFVATTGAPSMVSGKLILKSCVS
jgi:hypothetical protein